MPQLIEVEPSVPCQRGLQHFRAQINIFRANQRADRGALMPLLHLVPPAIDLIAHHGRLFNEQRALGQQRQQRFFRTSHRGEKFPAGKDADPTGGRHLRSHLLFVFRARAFNALAAQPGMHSGEQVLGYRRFSQRQQQRLVEARLRPLRFGIEFANGLDLVAEKIQCAPAGQPQANTHREFRRDE